MNPSMQLLHNIKVSLLSIASSIAVLQDYMGSAMGPHRIPWNMQSMHVHWSKFLSHPAVPMGPIRNVLTCTLYHCPEFLSHPTVRVPYRTIQDTKYMYVPLSRVFIPSRCTMGPYRNPRKCTNMYSATSIIWTSFIRNLNYPDLLETRKYIVHRERGR